MRPLFCALALVAAGCKARSALPPDSDAAPAAVAAWSDSLGRLAARAASRRTFPIPEDEVTKSEIDEYVRRAKLEIANEADAETRDSMLVGFVSLGVVPRDGWPLDSVLRVSSSSPAWAHWSRAISVVADRSPDDVRRTALLDALARSDDPRVRAEVELAWLTAACREGRYDEVERVRARLHSQEYSRTSAARSARHVCDPHDVGYPGKNVAAGRATEFTIARAGTSCVLAVFWADWCSPCLLEMPHVRAVREARDRGELGALEIVGVGVATSPESSELLEQHYGALWDRSAFVDESWARTAIPRGVPESWLVAGDGVLLSASETLRGERLVTALRASVESCEGTTSGAERAEGVHESTGRIPQRDHATTESSDDEDR